MTTATSAETARYAIGSKRPLIESSSGPVAAFAQILRRTTCGRGCFAAPAFADIGDVPSHERVTTRHGSPSTGIVESTTWVISLRLSSVPARPWLEVG